MEALFLWHQTLFVEIPSPAGTRVTLNSSQNSIWICVIDFKVNSPAVTEQVMWCNECHKHHVPKEFCISCGACLVRDYGYPDDDKDYCIRLVRCLTCSALNTVEYNIVERDPSDSQPVIEELQKTFDELWRSGSD